MGAEPLSGCFVAGTDTGVGKTVVSAAITAAVRARGATVLALKPLITGLDDPPEPGWPRDHELLAALCGQSAESVVLATYGHASSPHLAAQISGRAVPPVAEVEAWVRHVAAEAAGEHGAADPDEPGSEGRVTTIVEGVGGLLVPLGQGEDVRSLAVAVGLPLVVVARPGLGTINHTLLTLEAARAAGLTVAGVVLNPWPAEPDAIERSNLDTIAALGAVEVATLPVVANSGAEALAAAGGSLPLDRWL